MNPNFKYQFITIKNSEIKNGEKVLIMGEVCDIYVQKINS